MYFINTAVAILEGSQANKLNIQLGSVDTYLYTYAFYY